MGQIRYLYDLDYDPSDTSNPNGTYVPYDFVAPGHTGVANMQMNRDFARRESVVSIPGLDGVLDANGRNPGPTDRFDQSFAFRVFTNGDNDAAHDLLAAQVAPGVPQRLVYQMDGDPLCLNPWFAVGSNGRIGAPLAAANSWGHGGYVDFAVTWRRTVWTPRFSEASDVWGVNDGTWGTADGTWGLAFAVQLTLAQTPFALDATGTAGANLPTLPDTGPVITLDGPFGGAGGTTLFNAAPPLRDTLGNRVATQLTLPFPARAGDQYVLDCARQRFTFNGAPFRPAKPAYQPWYFAVWPGVVNICSAQCLGASASVGGYIVVDWFRKKA